MNLHGLVDRARRRIQIAVQFAGRVKIREKSLKNVGYDSRSCPPRGIVHHAPTSAEMIADTLPRGGIHRHRSRPVLLASVSSRECSTHRDNSLNY